jgi:membrane protein implicated in regulation of membrane protease activity
MNTQPTEQIQTETKSASIPPYLPGVPVVVENRSGRGPSTAVIILIASIAILLLIGFVAFTIWLAQTQATTIAAVRDILIIALALESCIFGVVILLLLIMVMRLVNMLEFEIKPILEKTNETVSTLRGTTNFVSQNVVQPAIRTRAQVAGVTQAIKTLFGNPRNNIK